MGKYKIDYYATSSGKIPVQEFIDDLPETAKSRVYNTLELLAEFGHLLRMPHTKKVVGTPLWELRILGKASVRTFYITRINQSFLLLHGFTKRKQKTPKKEIQIAITRLKECKNST